MHKIVGAHLQYVNNQWQILNKKKSKLLELKITQSWCPLSVVDVRTDGQMDGQTDGHMDGQTDGQTDGVGPLLELLSLKG